MNPVITSVTFGRTINVGNFENVRIEYRADVKPGQDAGEVMKALKRIANAEEERVRDEYAFRDSGS